MTNTLKTGQVTTEEVKEYYGKVLKKTDDLKTNACCTDDSAMSESVKKALSLVHDEVMSKYYGCGLVAPEKLEGTRILDLGCGAGRDVYVLSALTGEDGWVVGVDMTEEQLEVAERHKEYHARQFGYAKPNVEFRQGYIEDLKAVGIQDESQDIIVSNCVLNLSPDKLSVLQEAYRVLKEGGEFYFSDVYADRRISSELVDDPVLYGECLSGALYWNDFLRLAKEAGFADPRLVKSSPITIDNPEAEAKIGHIRFYSATYRLFKLPQLESECEDYGQAVIYRGGIPGHEEVFELDGHHRIEKGKVFPVCGNTWYMLKETRFEPHFEFIGNFHTHYGIFSDCGKEIPFAEETSSGSASGGCC